MTLSPGTRLGSVSSPPARIPWSLRDLASRERWALIAMTALGAAVRIAFHTGRSFGGDEVGTLFFVQKPAAYILTHFEVWLSNNYYILLEKGVNQLVGGSDWHLMAATFLAGIATIPAVAALGLKLSGRTTAVVAASPSADTRSRCCSASLPSIGSSRGRRPDRGGTAGCSRRSCFSEACPIPASAICSCCSELSLRST